MENRPLGEILVEAGLVSLAQIELALKEQLETELKIGEILAKHNFIRQKTADFFVEQWPIYLKIKNKKPLVYYFRKAGLLEKNQIKILLAQQEKEEHENKRFHHLAVENGYLKQETVNYFVKRLFDLEKNTHPTFANPYEILRQYIKGERNFGQTNLVKAPLIDLSLKEAIFDGSDLREANLTRTNLSHSSLARANLCSANLAKANLMSVNFEYALLGSANLQKSNLEQANFTAANLQKVDLTEAYLSHAFFAGADLRGAKLAKEYPYVVYYDSKTLFDKNFNPQQAGWKII